MGGKSGMIDINHLREWIGRSETRTEFVAATPVAKLSATLDHDDPAPQPGDSLPPLGHWLYLHEITRESELGSDGHGKRGGLIPPVPLPRRMFAGGRFHFHKPVRIGDTITRVTKIADVTHKEGRTGSLVFVLLKHEISTADGLAITEEQDLVYRDNPQPGAVAPAPQKADTNATWTRHIVPDDVLLFRYSALTFNGHRIHYDRRFCTDIEHYPGLVVHGPLLATMLADLVGRSAAGANLNYFAFRAVKPLFDIAPFTINGRLEADGKSAKLWASDTEGSLATEASAKLS
jgi:3-methylfumaryl-CoA hydratase